MKTKVCRGNYQPTITIMRKYKYTCVQCGESDKELWIHHINGDRKDNSLNNLVPLCCSCHRGGHMGRVDLDWLTYLK